MFFRKKTGDLDRKLTDLFDGLSQILLIQLTVASHGSGVTHVEDEHGAINLEALGYIYGFVDCALRATGRDMSDVEIGVPAMFHMLREIFPGSEKRYLPLIIENLNDSSFIAGMMLGGQRYSDFIITRKMKGGPMGLARLIVEGRSAASTSY